METESREEPALTPNTVILFQKLRAISLRSAARLQRIEMLSDTDLDDKDGPPA